MLQVSNLTKAYAARVLFENITFTVSAKEITGLVGRNGCGKTTLMKIIMGVEAADSGTVSCPKGYKVAYLDQHIKFTKPSLLEECVTALPKEKEYEHYLAEKILFGLGFSQEDLSKHPSEFSGGYQLRINLAKCLIQDPDLLLLDEPTNYLDIVSLRWMKTFLKAFAGGVLLITHDRGFMDSVCTHTVGIHRKGLKKVTGTTDKYYQTIEEEEIIYEKTRQNTDKKVKKMEEFVTRFKAKASKAKAAQSMMKRIEKMGSMNALDAEQVLGFRFNFKETPAKRLMGVENLSFGYTENHLLFTGLSFDLKPEDCVAVIGKNGKGKTTLLNVLAGQNKAITGEIIAHPSAEIGYYQQTNKKNLIRSNTVVEEITSSNPMLDTSQVRAICGAVMFSGSDADKKIKVLSGGEQGRVLLGKILAHENNVLLLDEPTNHLDLESIEALISQIKVFAGATMIVTHNEEMLRDLATKLIVFSRGKATLFNGSYDEFLEKIGWEEEEGAKNKKKSKVNRKEQKRLKAELVKERSKKLKPLKTKLVAVETNIQAAEEKLKEHEAQVASAAQTDDNDLNEIYKEIGSLQLTIASFYEDYEKLNVDIDVIQAEYQKKIQDLD